MFQNQRDYTRTNAQIINDRAIADLINQAVQYAMQDARQIVSFDEIKQVVIASIDLTAAAQSCIMPGGGLNSEMFISGVYRFAMDYIQNSLPISTTATAPAFGDYGGIYPRANSGSWGVAQSQPSSGMSFGAPSTRVGFAQRTPSFSRPSFSLASPATAQQQTTSAAQRYNFGNGTPPVYAPQQVSRVEAPPPTSASNQEETESETLVRTYTSRKPSQPLPSCSKFKPVMGSGVPWIEPTSSSNIKANGHGNKLTTVTEDKSVGTLAALMKDIEPTYYKSVCVTNPINIKLKDSTPPIAISKLISKVSAAQGSITSGSDAVEWMDELLRALTRNTAETTAEHTTCVETTRKLFLLSYKLVRTRWGGSTHPAQNEYLQGRATYDTVGCLLLRVMLDNATPMDKLTPEQTTDLSSAAKRMVDDDIGGLKCTTSDNGTETTTAISVRVGSVLAVPVTSTALGITTGTAAPEHPHAFDDITDITDKVKGLNVPRLLTRDTNAYLCSLLADCDITNNNPLVLLTNAGDNTYDLHHVVPSLSDDEYVITAIVG